MYLRTLLLISSEFIEGYRLLIERTRGDASTIEFACQTDPELSDWIEALQQIQATLDKRGQEFEPFLSRAPDEFREALADFRDRWTATLNRRAVALAADLDLDSI
jgi:hypothetical protein